MIEREVRHADADDVRGPLWEEAVAGAAARGAVVPAGAVEEEDGAEEAADGNLRRYARWQWRDFWRNRGPLLASGAVLGVWLLTYLAAHGGRTPGPHGFVDAPMQPQDLSNMAHVFFAFGGAFAALFGVGGIVSRERERGLQRFLFAKPVRPLRYYLQAFAVNSAGSLAVLAAAVLAAGALVGLPVATLLVVGVGGYLLTAGVTFLLSTLIRFDAPVAFCWLFGGFAVASWADAGWPGVRLASWLFPQGPAMALLRALSAGQHPERFALYGVLVTLVAALYGLVAFAAGVAVLRRRAIST